MPRLFDDGMIGIMTIMKKELEFFGGELLWRQKTSENIYIFLSIFRVKMDA